MTIRVGIADDQAMIRNGFRLQVQYTDDLELVGEASNGEQAVSLARSQAPDVLLMDVRMPVMDGIEATRRINADPDRPASGCWSSPRSTSTSTCTTPCAPARAGSSSRTPPLRTCTAQSRSSPKVAR